MSSHPPSGQQSDGKGISELVIATIPAALLYLIGWTYLYFYLQAFGIGISELELDLQTIFIYSYPPIRMLWLSYWGWVLLGVGALASGIWVVRLRTTPAARNALARWIFGVSTVSQGLRLFFAVSILAVLLVPAVRTNAVQAADRKWVSEGIRVEAIVKEPEKGEKSAWYESYKRCASRRALDLVFADKDAYYMLCISGVDESSGIVYEVRRDSGLASVRFARR